MNVFKDNSKIFIFLLFFYLLLLNLFQLSEQHWSSMLDQDIKMMYNSLLISSGIEQEYRDHPAYTTFLLLGGIFKFLSIFFDNFRIQEILKSENIETIRWKNSENYIKNYNNYAFIKLVKNPKVWLYKHTKKFVPSYKKKSEFLQSYCNQIKNEKGLRSHSYKLKPK